MKKIVLLLMVLFDILALSAQEDAYPTTKVEKHEVGILANDFNWMADCMNRQMNRLQNEVERQEAFTSAFAHELKTPLTSIIGYADTIRQMNLDPEETAMCADYIYRQGKRLQTLSYKLLELTMARKSDLSFSRISVTELVQEIVRTSQEVMKEKHLFLFNLEWIHF